MTRRDEFRVSPMAALTHSVGFAAWLPATAARVRGRQKFPVLTKKFPC
jgi:hypothetical protein